MKRVLADIRPAKSPAMVLENKGVSTRLVKGERAKLEPTRSRTRRKSAT